MLVNLISNGTVLSSFQLEQSVIEQKLTQNSVMAIRLHTLIDIQMIWNNGGKQFSYANTNVKH